MSVKKEICPTCKKEFWGTQGKVFCKRSCMQYKKICEECGKIYTARAYNAKVCAECAKYRRGNHKPKQEPLGYTSALIIVDWHYRKKLTIAMIAAELHRTPEEVTKFIKRLVITGKYKQILYILQQGGQAVKRDYRGYTRKISKGVI